MAKAVIGALRTRCLLYAAATLQAAEPSQLADRTVRASMWLHSLPRFMLRPRDRAPPSTIYREDGMKKTRVAARVFITSNLFTRPGQFWTYPGQA